VHGLFIGYVFFFFFSIFRECVFKERASDMKKEKQGLRLLHLKYFPHFPYLVYLEKGKKSLK
jgi:hypothetical protein